MVKYFTQAFFYEHISQWSNFVVEFTARLENSLGVFPSEFSLGREFLEVGQHIVAGVLTTKTLVAWTNFDVELACRAGEVQEFEQSSENNQNCKRN